MAVHSRLCTPSWLRIVPFLVGNSSSLDAARLQPIGVSLTFRSAIQDLLRALGASPIQLDTDVTNNEYLGASMRNVAGIRLMRLLALHLDLSDAGSLEHLVDLVGRSVVRQVRTLMSQSQCPHLLRRGWIACRALLGILLDWTFPGCKKLHRSCLPKKKYFLSVKSQDHSLPYGDAANAFVLAIKIHLRYM